MAITVTPKYKPFTYDELVKPLAGYWDKYDKEEAKLQEELKDLAKLKAIVDTAPEDNADRQKFDKLYKDFQNSVDILAERGLSIDNKNLFRTLRQEFNAQVPRILVAEEDARKARQEFMKLQNSGKYITPNNNNPGSFTWANYLDGNIPAFDPAVLKQEVFTKAAQQAEKVTKRVAHDPTVDSTKLKGYTAITQKQGLKFDNIEEMMANPLMQETYNTIRNSFNTEGWDEASINALDQEIKAGMFKGTFYDEKTDYQKNVSSNWDSNLDPFAKLQQKEALQNLFKYNKMKQTGDDITPEGNHVTLTPDGTLVVASQRDPSLLVRYREGKADDADKELKAMEQVALDVKTVDSLWDGDTGDGWGAYTDVDYYKANASNAVTYLKRDYDTSDDKEKRHYTRTYSPIHDEVVNKMFDQLPKEQQQAYRKLKLTTDDFLPIVVGYWGDDWFSDDLVSRYVVPIKTLVKEASERTWTGEYYREITDGIDFLDQLKLIPSQIASTYGDGDGKSHPKVLENFNKEVVDVFASKFLGKILSKVGEDADKQINSIKNVTDKKRKEIYGEIYQKKREEIFKVLRGTINSPSLTKEFNQLFKDVEKKILSKLINKESTLLYAEEEAERNRNNFNQTQQDDAQKFFDRTTGQ